MITGDTQRPHSMTLFSSHLREKRARLATAQ